LSRQNLPQTPSDDELLEEYRRRARTHPWLYYPVTCVPKILPWHESTATYRVLSGPNGGGKTTAGAADLVSYATGFNPIRKEKYPTPNICWAVCVEYKSAGNVMLKKLAEMLPKKEDGSRDWKHYKQDHLIVLNKPYYSEISIKSQKEGESSLLAERCAAIWVDEGVGGERGLENFGELQARGLPNQPLYMLFTLTPKLDTGLTWMMRKLWKDPKGVVQPHEDFITGTYCHQFELRDCHVDNGGFLTEEHILQKERDTDPDEAGARLRGEWTPFYERPAFSYGLMEKALARSPEQRIVRFRRTAFYQSIMEEAESGPCRVQRERESAHTYLGSWDPSSGLGRGHDPSAFTLFDRADLCQVFHARSLDMHPEQFAREIVLPACEHYNQAQLIIENNGEGGGAAVEVCKSYGNLYMQKNMLRAGGGYTDRFGWNTNEQSRGRIIDALYRALKEEKWTPSKDLIEEMSHMTKKMMPSGHTRIEHAEGYHDDLVMASGIALAVHYEEPVYQYPDMATLKPRWIPAQDPGSFGSMRVGSSPGFRSQTTLSES
jgi:hypothetical protein